MSLHLLNNARPIMYCQKIVQWETRNYKFQPSDMGLQFQTDGNLVIYNDEGIAMWDTKTYGNKATYLKVQNDGNLVLYGKDGIVFWSSKTYGRCGGWNNNNELK